MPFRVVLKTSLSKKPRPMFRRFSCHCNCPVNHPLFLRHSVPHSTGDCHQKRGAVCQNHLMDQNQNIIDTLEIWVGLTVLEAPGQECHVTLRMLILTSKLLEEPFNRTIDVSLLLNGKYSSLTHCERYLIFLPLFLHNGKREGRGVDYDQGNENSIG